MNTKETTSTKSILFEQIDALKGIAIFLVVLGHGIIFYPVDLHQNVVCESIFRWLSSVHMPLFFLISGFCFSFNQAIADNRIIKISAFYRIQITACECLLSNIYDTVWNNNIFNRFTRVK